MNLNFPVRRPFIPLVEAPARFSVAVCHRRAGKTVAALQRLIVRAIREQKPNARLAYIAPYLKQAKAVAWDYLRRMAQQIPGTAINETELRADLPSGARIRLFGADNPDALRGLYLDDVVLDEYADMDPRTWTQIVLPALADRGGSALFIGTPKGSNDLKRIYDEAEHAPGWSRMLLRASESGLLAADELRQLKSAMSEDEYRQEFECSWTAAMRGAYYGRLLEQAEADGRICRVPYDPSVPVVTAWDLGWSDSTAIWFIQRVRQELHAIDYYEASGKTLPEIAQAVLSRPYLYGDHILPHDAEAKQLAAGGSSTLSQLQALGLRCRAVGKGERVQAGIEAVRMLLPRMWFDAEKCRRGLECLRQYQEEWDEVRRATKGHPLHDWSSHGADALRMYAIGHRATLSVARPTVPQPSIA